MFVRTRFIKITSIICAAALLAFSISHAVPEGYLDVTTLGADPTGQSDSTVAIQNGMNQARDNQLVLWFPGGDYLVSDRLVADQPDGEGNNYHTVLMGSTIDPNNRARIILAPNANGFDDPANRKVLFHFISTGTVDAETGNATLYNQGVVSLDIQIGSGNDGAVGIRMQGAEGCTIQDVNIDLTQGGHTGIWGIPGSGGATHGVRVEGGNIGIDTRGFSQGGGGTQPTAVVTGARLIDQSDYAIFATARGALVLVGSHLERSDAGELIRLREHWQGQPYDASLLIVDSILEFKQYSSGNAVIEMNSGSTGRSFVLENTYVSKVDTIWHPSATANNAGWTHVKRLAVEVQPEVRNWGQPREPVFIDGLDAGTFYMDAESSLAPPGNLTTQHALPTDFPTWETSGAVNVKTLGALGDGVTDDWAVLQQAIDNNEIVFFPKGIYRVSQTLNLSADSKLIGVWCSMSVLKPISTLQNRFNGVADGSPDAPLIKTADSAVAETYLGFMRLMRQFPLAQHNPTSVGNYVLEWRSGGNSVVRHVMFQSNPDNNIRPDQIADKHYDLTQSINPNHPQDDFPSGMWAWPCAYPSVQIRGNGGGRFYTFWMHGRQGLRDDVPFIRVEDTSEPLRFYHMHIQQQDSLNHAEFINADNVTIYGTKGEVKGSILYFENCDNVRLFGHGGLSSPEPVRNPPYLFRFINCTNFLLSGLGDTINQGSGSWKGGIFDRWYHANLFDFSILQDDHASRGEIIVPATQRPIIYLQGDPVSGKHPDQGDNTVPVITMLGNLDGNAIPLDSGVLFIATANDVEDGSLDAGISWVSSLDGVLGNGSSLIVESLSSGIHLISASVSDSSGSSASATITLSVVSAGTTQQVTLIPTDDAYTKVDAPDTNYGSSNKLRARGSQGHIQLYKFDLSAINGVVSHAQLELALANGVTGDLNVYGSTDDGWSESSVTHNLNRPASGQLVGTATTTGVQGSWSTIDVKSFIDGQLTDGLATFVGETTGSTLLLMFSKEQSGSEPKLVVDYSQAIANQPPVVSIASPVSGSQVTEGEQVTLSGSAADPEEGDLSQSGVWYSDIDGPIGTGQLVTLSTLSNGLHTISYYVVDAGQLVDIESVTLEVQQAISLETLTFSPVADAQIRGDQPSQNYGGVSKHRHRLNEQSSSLYRFDISQVSGAITSATFRVVLGATDSGDLELHALLDDSWDENLVTYQSRPLLGSSLGSQAVAGTAGDYLEVDVTAHAILQQGDGLVGISVSPLSNSLVRLYSKESSYIPELVVTYADSGPPNLAPEASSVGISGSAVPGEILTGQYVYQDAELDAEGASILEWFSSSDSALDGSDTLVGTGAAYLLAVSDEGRYLFFVVTPIALSGEPIGNPAASAASAMVISSIWTPLDNSDMTNGLVVGGSLSDLQADQGWVNNGFSWTPWYFDSANGVAYYDESGPNGSQAQAALSYVLSNTQDADGSVAFQLRIKNLEGSGVANFAEMRIYGVSSDFTINHWQAQAVPSDRTGDASMSYDLLGLESLTAAEHDWDYYTTQTYDLLGQIYDYFVVRIFVDNVLGAEGDFFGVDELYVDLTYAPPVITWTPLANGDFSNGMINYGNLSDVSADAGWVQNGFSWTPWYMDSVNGWAIFDADGPNGTQSLQAIGYIYADGAQTTNTVKYRFEMKNTEGSGLPNTVQVRVYGVNSDFTINLWQEAPSPSDRNGDASMTYTLLSDDAVGGQTFDWASYETDLIDLQSNVYDYYVVRVYVTDVNSLEGDFLAIDNLEVGQVSP